MCWSLHGLMAKVLEFKTQLRYYVHFQIHTFGKGMNPHYPLRY